LVLFADPPGFIQGNDQRDDHTDISALMLGWLW